MPRSARRDNQKSWPFHKFWLVTIVAAPGIVAAPQTVAAPRKLLVITERAQRARDLQCAYDPRATVPYAVTFLRSFISTSN